MAGEHMTPKSREPLTPAETEFVRELFGLHKLALYRYLKRLLASRDDAQEILQETYLRLLRQPNFEPLRRNARAYLFQTATNLARDVFRQRAAKGITAEMEMFSASGLDSPDWSSWPEHASEGEMVGRIVVASLEELQPRVRAALLLNRFRDLTHEQIAVRMNVSKRTVERYIKEGLAHVAGRLKAQL